MPTDNSVDGSNSQSSPTVSAADSRLPAIPDDLIELGRILGGHGIRGWVKIQPFSVEADAMIAAKQWWLAAPVRAQQSSLPVSHDKTDRKTDFKTAPLKSVNVSWAKAHGQFFLAALKGVSDRNASDALKGQSVLVSRQLFPPLEPDEYYWVDLLGCVVTTDAGEQALRLGVVHEVLDNPAHALLAVKRQRFDVELDAWVDQSDAKDRPIITLIPFVSAHIESVDLSDRLISTHWPADF